MEDTCSHNFYRHHYYIIEPAKKEWSRARCKWCKATELFHNEPKIKNFGGKAEEATSVAKREFLRSNNITVTDKYWDEGEKEKVLLSVQRIGIRATAKAMDLPASTVALWGKGKSPFVYKYPYEFQKKAVRMALSTKNVRRTAINLSISRSALQYWIKNMVV